MMETVDELLAKTEEPPVLFVKFTDKIAKYGLDCLYCFVEDYDMPYYAGIISSLTDKTWTSIRCKGKDNVLSIYEYIKDMEFYKQYDKRFFVDKDFDNNSNVPKDIYVTSAYSIENYYIMDECMRKILETEYEIDPVGDEELFERTIAHFKSKREEFHNAVVYYNAWYACLHDDPNWSHEQISLNSTFPKKLLTIDIENSMEQTYTLEDIETLHQTDFYVEEQQINQKIATLSTDYCSNLRGKFEIEFVYRYIIFLNKDAGTKARRFTKKKKNFNFTLDGALTAMSQYAVIPDGLKHYVKTGVRAA